MTIANLDREQQVILGKKISAIVEKKVGLNYSSSTKQGGGVVAILKFTTDSTTAIDKLKSYLRTELGLLLQNPKERHKNHGSGMRCTVLINLSEIQPDAVLRIEGIFKVSCSGSRIAVREALEESKDKPAIIPAASAPAPIAPVVQVAPVIPVAENVAVKRNRNPSTGKMSLSRYIISFLSFEVSIIDKILSSKIGDFFTYDKEEKGDFTVLHCADEKTSWRIEQLLNWLIGSPNIIVATKDITVDLSKIKNMDEKSYQIRFSLPPTPDSKSDDIRQRLLRVNPSAKPKDIRNTRRNLYAISYTKKTTSISMHEILSGMGWNTEYLPAKNLLLVYTNKKEEAVVATVVSEVPAMGSLANDQQEEIPVASQSFVSVPADKSSKLENKKSEVAPVNVSAYIFPGLPIGFIEKLKTKEEVYLELEALYNDQALFSKLNEEIQLRIITVMQEGYKQMHPNAYAEMLLELYK